MLITVLRPTRQRNSLKFSNHRLREITSGVASHVPENNAKNL